MHILSARRGGDRGLPHCPIQSGRNKTQHHGNQRKDGGNDPHGWLCLSNSFYWRWLIAAFLSLVLCLGDGMLGRTAGADDVSEGVSKGKHRRDDDDRGD